MAFLMNYDKNNLRNNVAKQKTFVTFAALASLIRPAPAESPRTGM